MAAEIAPETLESQAVDFVLPSLGSDMDEGTVIEWLVEIGDAVHKGDVLLRVDTEKSDIDVEVWHDAVVADIVIGAGETVSVGTTLARLRQDQTSATTRRRPASEGNAAPPAPVIDERPERPERSILPPAPRPPAPRPPERKGQSVLVDPRLVLWPTPGASRVPPAAVSVDPSREPGSRAERRQARVAALMERSNREIPHFHLRREIDLSSALTWLEERNAAVTPTQRVLPAAILLRAVAQAAADSVVNGTWEDGQVDAAHVDLGVAVHLRGGGLVTPVLPAAETMDLETLMSELQAMVGFGRIAERAVAVEGRVVAVPTVIVTLSADHRVVNGRAGARFIDAVVAAASNPED